MLQLDDSFVLEFPVRTGHGVGIDQQCYGDLTHARQLFAGAYNPGFDRVLHLFDQLKVEGNPGRRAQIENHSVYSINTVDNLVETDFTD